MIITKIFLIIICLAITIIATYFSYRNRTILIKDELSTITLKGVSIRWIDFFFGILPFVLYGIDYFVNTNRSFMKFDIFIIGIVTILVMLILELLIQMNTNKDRLILTPYKILFLDSGKVAITTSYIERISINRLTNRIGIYGDRNISFGLSRINDDQLSLLLNYIDETKGLDNIKVNKHLSAKLN